MQRLVDFIEQQIDNPDLCLAKVSQALHVSNMQLYRRVKQCSGISPNQFIRTLRLQRGRQLLRTTDWNISEIAYSVGFNDPNYFTRSFSQEFNLSPTSYRTKISQSSAVPV